MNSALAPHLALGCLAREVIEIVMVESRRLEIDATDMMLIACVAYLSTAHALSNPSLISDYDYGNNPLPLEYCRGIIVKEVAITLNMNRETVRRRLNYLVKRDFLIRDGRCFFIPYQGGDTDFTGNTRLLATRAITKMRKLFDVSALSPV